LLTSLKKGEAIVQTSHRRREVWDGKSVLLKCWFYRLQRLGCMLLLGLIRAAVGPWMRFCSTFTADKLLLSQLFIDQFFFT
jgi:hypothetical protein